MAATSQFAGESSPLLWLQQRYGVSWTRSRTRWRLSMVCFHLFYYYYLFCSDTNTKFNIVWSTFVLRHKWARKFSKILRHVSFYFTLIKSLDAMIIRDERVQKRGHVGISPNKGVWPPRKWRQAKCSGFFGGIGVFKRIEKGSSTVWLLVCFLKGLTAVQFILFNFANYSPFIAMELKVRLDYQPLFGKMSPHSSKTGPGRRRKSSLT